MAKPEEKNEQAPVQAAESPTMEEILQSIRGVISGDDSAQDESDVLELVEIVEEGSILNALKPDVDEVSMAVPEDVKSEKSILDDIDEALEKDVEKAGEDAGEVMEPKVEENIIAEPEALANQQEVIEEKTVNTDISIAENNMNNSEIDSPIVSDVIERKDIDTDVDLESIEHNKSNKNSTRLLDEQAAKQSSVSIKELVNSIHDKHIESPYTRKGTSLEDLVIEAMKPFLAEWLNKNLPVIVRKIVEKEVKRLIPKEEDDY